MPETRTVGISLSEAVLCVGCGVISNAKNGHCPFCAGSGESLVNLAKVMNRNPDECIVALNKDLAEAWKREKDLQGEITRLRGVVEQYQRFTGGANVAGTSNGTDEAGS